MITKFLAAIVISVFLFTLPVHAENYPFRIAKNPNIISMMEYVRDKGDQVIGLVNDYNDDYVMWVKTGSGDCKAYLILFSTGQILDKGCEEALDIWDDVVSKGAGKPVDSYIY